MLAPAIIRAGPGLSCAGSPRQDRSARLAACGGHLYFLLAQAGRCTYCAAIVSRGEYLHAAPAVVVGCMLHRSPPSYDFVRLTSRESAGSSPRSELPSKGTGESFTPHLSGRRFRAPGPLRRTGRALSRKARLSPVLVLNCDASAALSGDDPIAHASQASAVPQKRQLCGSSVGVWNQRLGWGL